MWNVEVSFWGYLTAHHAEVHWNMECGIPYSNLDSKRLECGMWIYFLGNVKPLTMLKCIGTLNVEIHILYPNPNILKFGIWNVDFQILHPAFQISAMGIGMWISIFYIPHSLNFHFRFTESFALVLTSWLRYYSAITLLWAFLFKNYMIRRKWPISHISDVSYPLRNCLEN